RQILRENNCLQTLLQHLKSHSLTIVSNACGTLWNLSARNAKDQEALWDMGAVSMLKNLIHSKHKMIAMGSAAALRNLMANRPAKYKDANIMSPGSSLPSLHVRKQKALEAELDAQHLSETFDNIDNLSPKTSHRNKQRQKQNLYSEYALDSGRHNDDSICRSDNFNTGNLTVLSPYLNTTVLQHSSSSRESRGESSRSEQDRSLDRERASGPSSFHPATESAASNSKRIGLQMSTTAAQIAKVMEEVSSLHISHEDRNSSCSADTHCMPDERAILRRASTAQPHSNVHNFNKSESSSRPCPVPYGKMEYKIASNDSLNSVSSSDGYGKRGQMKPSIESYSEDDEGKFCNYEKYPADLAHKIHSANHMDDNDDQPIDYSLKYSTDVPSSSQKPSFVYSKSSSVQKTGKDHIHSSTRKSSRPSTTSNRQNQLHPNSAQNRGGPTQVLQKPASCKAPSINQETIQTYCVEDTPICFSRCSSLSSLSSAEDGKEKSGTSNTETSMNEIPSTSENMRKPNRLQASNVSHSDSTRHKAVEFSSGAKSPSKSGAQTPKSPPEHCIHETPLMFSRCTSVSSLDSFESHSIASSVQSEPCSGMVSGIISPSDLPDSPGQTMPPSRSKTPPPAQTAQIKRDTNKVKGPTNTEKREIGPKQRAVNAAVQRVQVLPDNDTLLHFATETTPDGFSCASSLSALSVDEPYIQKDVELKIMPPVCEDDQGNELEPEKDEDTSDKKQSQAEKLNEPEKDLLDDSDDDDIEILEECINSAMPTKSSRKAKKLHPGTTSRIPPPVARKPSQLPVYKHLPSQNRVQPQKHVNVSHGEDIPRVYCVEGTPINFSTATSLSDLTIESPPNELASTDGVSKGAELKDTEKRDAIPTEGRSTDDAETSMTSQEDGDKKKPTSPVKPMPQSSEYRARLMKDLNDKLQSHEERTQGTFAFDSPHHYTPIEGTPYCFSRNDSLSSLDFDDDDTDLSKEKAELRKEKEEKAVSTTESKKRQTTFPQASKQGSEVGAITDEKQNFAIENTPVCFSRNSSLSSLSDIDQENNNKETELAKKTEPSNTQDTPVCFSRNSSLSSLSIDSEDDLLQECISSAMPKKKKQPARSKGDAENSGITSSKTTDGILAEPDLTLDLRDVHSPDSELAFSPDSETFDWKAIQEGANSIVSSLHQAAAAASLSRQASSDSDSILSLKSGISLGSPFHLTPDQEEKPFTSNKGPRILKPGEKSTLESKKSEEENTKGLKGGKKVYKSHSKQTNMPMVSRGRTMIHIPGVRNSSPSTSPVSNKTPPKNTPSKSPSSNQISSNSPRGFKGSGKSDPNPVGRQTGAQGGSSKGTSRSGSRDSTPSRPAQQPLSRPMQSPGRSSISPGRNGINPPNKLSQLPRTSSPSPGSTKSSGSGRMAYTSPGRHLGQQPPSKQTNLPKSASGIPRSESASKGLNHSANSGSGKKVELSRMSSTKSSGSESDRSERPVLVRQSTFIKEAPSPTLRRKLEESASFESLSPSSRPASPTRLVSAHSPHQINSWRKSPHNHNPPLEPGDGRVMRRHDITRSHSESPSRLPVNRSGTWKREHSKHSSSLPRVSTWRRTGSSSSILSASSESSEKAKSEDGHKQTKENQVPLKGTWRKIKENEIPQMNTHSHNSSPGACSATECKPLVYQMAPAVSKTEDVWVRIEDCPINNPRSGRSPTGNTPPVIDNVPENSPEKKASETKSMVVNPATTPETTENPVVERTPFSSTSSSKHSSPSGAVAARVTPFNYNPSP
uniref:APC regulator of WNT signaling pathway n=1 Tax=Latimeria chalumnae TaxID=7897 RepID=H3A7W4_LATCH